MPRDERVQDLSAADKLEVELMSLFPITIRDSVLLFGSLTQ